MEETGNELSPDLILLVWGLPLVLVVLVVVVIK
jgi:hypothetical protein